MLLDVGNTKTKIRIQFQIEMINKTKDSFNCTFNGSNANISIEYCVEFSLFSV